MFTRFTDKLTSIYSYIRVEMFSVQHFYVLIVY